MNNKNIYLIESEDGEATWTPEEEGKYTIKVTASADGLDDVTESKTYTVKDKQSEDENEFTANIATKSSLEETVGNKVKFTASGKRNKDPENRNGDHESGNGGAERQSGTCGNGAGTEGRERGTCAGAV